MRVTASKDGKVALDSEQKLPGRGAYLCYRRECVVKAKKRDSLRRALRCAIPEEIWNDIDSAVADVSFLDDEPMCQVPQDGDNVADAECNYSEGVDRREE